MSTDVSRIVGGLVITDDNLNDLSGYLSGVGVPGGDGGRQDGSELGTIYLQQDADGDNLQTWSKTGTGANSNADWDRLASKGYVDNLLIAGTSWREPVLVVDETTYANIAAAEAVANLPAGEIDGVVIQAGDRLLFTDLTSGNENVYIVSGAPLAWVFTEDANLASDGDAVLVQDGTGSEQQWVYNGTMWVLFAAGDQDELQAIRDFIGKDGVGAEAPIYTSTDIVTQNGTLEAAIGEVDNALGPLTFTEQNFVTNGDDITLNLDGLDIQLGSGTHSSTNIVLDANDVTENFSALDVAIGDRLYTNNTYLTDGETISASLEAIADELGNEVSSTNLIAGANSINANLSALDVGIGDQVYTEDNVVTDGETVTASIDALDVAVGNLSDDSLVTKTLNVTTLATVASVLVADAEIVMWRISAEDVTNTSNRITAMVSATTDGSSVDHETISILRLGTNIPGIGPVIVDISGGLMRLRIDSTNGVDVSVKRILTDTYN